MMALVAALELTIGASKTRLQYTSHNKMPVF